MALSKLKGQFKQAIQELQATPPDFGNPKLMPKAVKAIRKRVNGLGNLQGATDHIFDALHLLELEGADAAVKKQGRYLCWGMMANGPGGPLLLKEEKFPEFVAAVRRGFQDGALRMVAWRGLLEGYLTASDDVRSQALKNWQLLRAFLVETLPDIIESSRVKPDWLVVLESHKNLLEDDPCDQYAESVLQGDDEVLAPLREELKIPGDSWFWHDLVLSQVKAAVEFNDNEFVESLDTLLPILDKNTVLIGEALRLLLTRYADGLSEYPHQALQEFSVKHWGSPALFSQAKWGLVEPDAKRMVMEWLVLEDLRDFFEVLQEDGEADNRRFDYWIRFIKQIEYAKIALGKAAIASRKPDMVDLRKRKRGRFCALSQSGAHNNAFILKIGEYFLVEFSQTGNASYGYSAESIPFNLKGREISIYNLKHEKHVLRERHADTNMWGSWENRFDASLAMLGIYPDTEALKEKSRKARQPSRKQPRSSPPVKKARPVELDESALQDLCETHYLEVIDKREKNGAVWVRHFRQTGVVAKALKRMGFKFAAGKGFWRK